MNIDITPHPVPLPQGEGTPSQRAQPDSLSLWERAGVRGNALRAERAVSALEGDCMIVGIGSDITDIRRIEQAIERYGDRFLDRIFTEAERAKSDGRAARAASYAQALRRQGSVLEGLGTGVARGVFLRDMGVVNLPTGQPAMQLTGGAAARLKALIPRTTRRKSSSHHRRLPACPGLCNHLRVPAGGAPASTP